MSNPENAFDPSYGYSLADLLNVPPPTPVAGFADFWRERWQRIEHITTNPRLSPSPLRLSGLRVYELVFDSSDGVRIGGWLTVPESGTVKRGLIVGHGYGGREVPTAPLPVTDCAAVFPCLRGISRSPLPGVSSDPAQHVLQGIENRNHYILGGCVDDVWLAVSALLELYPQVLGKIDYMGTSFGGGIGALATPWDHRIGRVHLALPTFGHQRLRLTLPCNGSGEALRQAHLRQQLNISDTLAYYDAACASSFVRIPVHVAAARADGVVPPPGQFAVYNAAPAALRRLYVLDEGHASYPAQAAQESALFKELEEFFAAS